MVMRNIAVFTKIPKKIKLSKRLFLSGCAQRPYSLKNHVSQTFGKTTSDFVTFLTCRQVADIRAQCSICLSRAQS